MVGNPDIRAAGRHSVRVAGNSAVSYRIRWRRSPKVRQMKWPFIGLVIVCLAACFIPIRYLAAPQWDVWVKNETGAPLPGLSVRLTYENYSTESESHEITLVTDQSGHVAFPPQHQAASLLQREFYSARSALGGVHASFGRHAFVFVFGGGYEGEAVNGPYDADWNGFPGTVASTVIAKRTVEAR